MLILILCGRAHDGATAYQVRRQDRRQLQQLGSTGRGAGGTMNRLAERGYLRAVPGIGKTRRKVVRYVLTDPGLHALRAWLEQPAPVPVVDSEATMRLQAWPLVGTALITRSLQESRQAVRIERARLELEQQQLIARGGPELEQLRYDLRRSLLDTYLAWLDRVAKAIPDEDRTGLEEDWRN